MASFTSADSSPAGTAGGPIKTLVLGDPGSGKTGALLALAASGYNVRVLDFDNGVQIFGDYLRNPASPYNRAGPGGLWPSGELAAMRSRVHYQTITDPMRNLAGKLVPRSATAWTRAAKLLDDWTSEGEKFGPVSSWGPRDVLAIDTLTFASRRAFQFILGMNARLGQTPHQSDYYQAQMLVEDLLSMLYDEGVGCNVVVNCHIAYDTSGDGPRKGYPDTVGKALWQKIGRYFNQVVQAKTQGFGASQKHIIATTGDSVVELKNTAPLRVRSSYELGSGLAEFFRDLQGQGPQASEGSAKK